MNLHCRILAMPLTLVGAFLVLSIVCVPSGRGLRP